mmetsp:Transcript_3178/g.11487  ORF Transcript_3178/g.11487 Transcript_3178/m.11487 type:complete len:276 (-) Transcript_3178:505-1332(-)
MDCGAVQKSMSVCSDDSVPAFFVSSWLNLDSSHSRAPSLSSMTFFAVFFMETAVYVSLRVRSVLYPNVRRAAHVNSGRCLRTNRRCSNLNPAGANPFSFTPSGTVSFTIFFKLISSCSLRGTPYTRSWKTFISLSSSAPSPFKSHSMNTRCKARMQRGLRELLLSTRGVIGSRTALMAWINTSFTWTCALAEHSKQVSRFANSSMRGLTYFSTSCCEMETMFSEARAAPLPVFPLASSLQPTSTTGAHSNVLAVLPLGTFWSLLARSSFCCFGAK